MTDTIQAFRGSGPASLPAVPAGGAISTAVALPPPETPEFELNLRAILRILLKWRWLFVAFAVAGLAVATAMTLLATPLYRATATIEIKRQETQIMKESSIEPVTVNDPAAMATQFGLMQSRDLAVRVAQRLNLASNPAYAPPSLPREARENIAVGRLRGGLSVAPVGTSRLMLVPSPSWP